MECGGPSPLWPELSPGCAGLPMSELDAQREAGKRRLRVPPLRWVVFSVVATTLLSGAILLGWRLRTQQRLIDRIEEGWGSVGTEPIGPEWLRSRVSENSLRLIDPVVHVGARGNFSDADVALLRPQSRVKWLDLGETQVTDASIEALLSLRELELVHLDGVSLSSKALGRL